MPYFPVIGLILGIILAGLDYFFQFILLPPALSSALLIAILVVLTGASHLDGLVDTCDGLVAGKTPAERLEIMKDSRTGAFGVVGAVVVLLLKLSAMESVAGFMRLPALLLMPVLSRWGMVLAIFIFPYARTAGTGLAFKQGARWYRLAIATVVALVVSVFLFGVTGPVIVVGIALVVWAVGAYIRPRLGGLTGDSYGAINEIGEMVALVLIIIVGRWL